MDALSIPAGLVMPGLVPGIHVLLHLSKKTWMAGTSPAMTRKLAVPAGGDKMRVPQPGHPIQPVDASSSRIATALARRVSTAR